MLTEFDKLALNLAWILMLASTFLVSHITQLSSRILKYDMPEGLKAHFKWILVALCVTIVLPVLIVLMVVLK